MRILTNGKTRVVVLCGPFALKFARIRLQYPLERLISHIRSKRVGRRAAAWKALPGGRRTVAVNAFLPGVVANRNEYRNRTKAAKYDLAPTYGTLFYLVNVQARGEPATEQEARTHQIAIAARGVIPDVSAKQFCTFDGHVRLVDYANVELQPFLG